MVFRNVVWPALTNDHTNVAMMTHDCLSSVALALDSEAASARCVQSDKLDVV